MSYQRLAYADADSAGAMRTDCRVVRVGLRRRRHAADRDRAPARSTLDGVLHCTTMPEIRVSDAAARLATALHLHLD